MKPRILLTGKSGQIGSELAVLLPRLGHVTALGRRELDLTSATAIRVAVKRATPQVIVNAAAYTDVNGAESHEDQAALINGRALRVIAEEAARFGALVVHYSTDYVFDGEKTSPYLETDSPNPLNAYGRSKLAGERALLGSGVPHLVFRTSWVYGMHGKNFFLSVLRLASEKEQLQIVSDQTGAPSWSRMIAAATFRVLNRLLAWGYQPRVATGFSGIYHLTSGGETSWAGFASAILEEIHRTRKASRRVARAIGDKPLKARMVVPIRSEQFRSPACRPAYSVLSNEKFVRRFGFCLPDWRQQLQMAVSDLPSDELLWVLKRSSSC